MITRITAGAFLTYGNKILLMKHGLHKELRAGLWAGIGGHLNITDIKNPRALDFSETCYREVQEETGIKKFEIHNLKLKYITVRKDNNEIRVHHHYFGELKSEVPLPKCVEGELFWKDKNDIFNLPMSTSVKEAVKHWFFNPKSNSVFLVAVCPENNAAIISEV